MATSQNNHTRFTNPKGSQLDKLKHTLTTWRGETATNRLEAKWQQDNTTNTTDIHTRTRTNKQKQLGVENTTNNTEQEQGQMTTKTMSNIMVKRDRYQKCPNKNTQNKRQESEDQVPNNTHNELNVERGRQATHEKSPVFAYVRVCM